MKRIVILMHEFQRGGGSNHLLFNMTRLWQEQGLDVRRQYGIDQREECDLLIPQINLTHRPAAYDRYIRSYPTVANAELTDISKRRISTQLVEPGDGYDGPVIVKTDANASGHGEFRLARHRCAPWAKVRRKAGHLADRLPGQRLRWCKLLQPYPIFDRVADVPRGAFANPALVIERFRPERDGRRYCVRQYFCFGDRMRHLRTASDEPYMKRAQCEIVEEGMAVPEAVLAFRRELGMDFGKIDYTMPDGPNGEAVIIDVNPNPGARGGPDRLRRSAVAIAEGVWWFLSKG